MSLRAAAVLSGCALAGEVRVAIGLAGTDGPPPQEALPALTLRVLMAHKLRTVQLWGLRTKALYARP